MTGRCTWLSHCGFKPITWILVHYADRSMFAGEVCANCALLALDYVHDLSAASSWPTYMAWRAVYPPYERRGEDERWQSATGTGD